MISLVADGSFWMYGDYSCQSIPLRSFKNNRHTQTLCSTLDFELQSLNFEDKSSKPEKSEKIMGQDY